MASIKRKRAAPAPVLPEVLQNFVDTRMLTPELAQFLVIQQMTTRDLLAQLPESLPELLASFADAEAVRPAGARCALLLVIKQCHQSLIPAPPPLPTIPAVNSVVAPPPAPLSLASLEAAATSLAQPAPAKVAGKFTYPDLLHLGDKLLTAAMGEKDRDDWQKLSLGQLMEAGFQHSLVLQKQGRLDEAICFTDALKFMASQIVHFDDESLLRLFEALRVEHCCFDGPINDPSFLAMVTLHHMSICDQHKPSMSARSSGASSSNRGHPSQGGTPICTRFNDDRCFSHSCRFQHCCSGCFQWNHPKKECPTSRPVPAKLAPTKNATAKN